MAMFVSGKFQIQIQRLWRHLEWNDPIIKCHPVSIYTGCIVPLPCWQVPPVFGPRGSRSSSLSVITTDRPSCTVVDCRQPSFSGRRCSSLEQSFPWLNRPYASFVAMEITYWYIVGVAVVGVVCLSLFNSVSFEVSNFLITPQVIKICDFNAWLFWQQGEDYYYCHYYSYCYY